MHGDHVDIDVIPRDELTAIIAHRCGNSAYHVLNYVFPPSLRRLTYFWKMFSNDSETLMRYYAACKYLGSSDCPYLNIFFGDVVESVRRLIYVTRLCGSEICECKVPRWRKIPLLIASCFKGEYRDTLEITIEEAESEDIPYYVPDLINIARRNEIPYLTRIDFIISLSAGVPIPENPYLVDGWINVINQDRIDDAKEHVENFYYPIYYGTHYEEKNKCKENSFEVEFIERTEADLKKEFEFTQKNLPRFGLIDYDKSCEPEDNREANLDFTGTDGSSILGLSLLSNMQPHILKEHLKEHAQHGVYCSEIRELTGNAIRSNRQVIELAGIYCSGSINTRHPSLYLGTPPVSYDVGKSLRKKSIKTIDGLDTRLYEGRCGKDLMKKALGGRGIDERNEGLLGSMYPRLFQYVTKICQFSSLGLSGVGKRKTYFVNIVEPPDSTDWKSSCYLKIDYFGFLLHLMRVGMDDLDDYEYDETVDDQDGWHEWKNMRLRYSSDRFNSEERQDGLIVFSYPYENFLLPDPVDIVRGFYAWIVKVLWEGEVSGVARMRQAAAELFACEHIGDLNQYYKDVGAPRSDEEFMRSNASRREYVSMNCSY